jgi:hypothetical protein
VANKQPEQPPGGEQWRSAPELPPDIFAALHKANRAINPVTIVATVDTSGRPRTAPFGSLRAITPRLLRLACGNYHDTYANLCRDGRASVAVLAPPNIAVSIYGRARIVKPQMDIAKHLVAVEIDIDEVKNDMMRRGIIDGSVGFTPPEDLRGFYIGAIAEIEDM